jgi:hypothetical protein
MTDVAERYSGYRMPRHVSQHIIDLIAAGAGAGGVLQAANWSMAANATSSDEDLATSNAIATTPNGDGLVAVTINGAFVTVGDGTKVAACYFSGDDGTTPRTIENIIAGDKLYWMGSVAGFELQSDWLVGFLYIA